MMEIITRKEAKKLGKKWYFTGVSCARGHIAERLVQNCSCRECNNIKSREFREGNPTYHHEYNKQYYPNNKERIQRASAAYYNRIKTENYDLYKERHDKNHVAYRRRHRHQLKEREHNYRNSNPGAVNASTAKRRAKKMQATPCWADYRLIREIYEDCQTINTISRMVGGNEYYVVDHIIPLQGRNVSGLHVADNLRIIPTTENSIKSNKLINELLGETNER